MELDFAYRIYIQSEKLGKTLRYLHDHCDPEFTDFEFQGDSMFHIDRSVVGDVKTKMEIYKPERLNCCIIVDNDQTIANYYLNALARIYNPDANTEESYIKYWQHDKNHFKIGNIELYIADYSDLIENTLELSFFAVSSEMSVLFIESESIYKFFRKLCHEVKADHACIYKEEYGIQVMMLDGKDTNYTIPSYWYTFQLYGVIPVIKEVLKDKL